MAERKGPAPAADGGEPGFERSLARLEAIVASMEQGDQPLEQSLALFEEGVALARALETQLQAAEMKVEALVRGTAGEPAIVPFEPPADEP
ncbi:MAG: exodeoxyribonuclease VII small subunit [Acidobacteria bacterium]|jgi:exodeoxyribonuclease VII small subunit|nr:exodeoxyribonuclease VII small subunit [Acidobacteriota bacterium]